MTERIFVISHATDIDGVGSASLMRIKYHLPKDHIFFADYSAETIGKISETLIPEAAKGEGVVIERWLKEKGIGYDRFIIAEGHSGKLLNGADIYVDDYSDLAVEIAARGKRVVLLKQPWNSSFAEKNRDKLISVAENWDDVRRLLLRDAVQG